MNKSDLCPYLESMAKTRRLCPKCLSRQTRIEPSLSPNGAYERCDCGYFQSITAPKAAQVPWDGKAPWRNPSKSSGANVVRFPGGRSGGDMPPAGRCVYVVLYDNGFPCEDQTRNIEAVFATLDSAVRFVEESGFGGRSHDFSLCPDAEGDGAVVAGEFVPPSGPGFMVVEKWKVG